MRVNRKRHYTRLKHAFELSKEVEPVESSRVVALLYVKNNLVTVGFNHCRKSVFNVRYSNDGIYHAETHAIHQFIKMYGKSELINSKTDLYVARSKRDPNKQHIWAYGLSRPCCGCKLAINDFSIDRVFYTLDGFTLEFNHRNKGEEYSSYDGEYCTFY